jgi:hypothetical protein
MTTNKPTTAYWIIAVIALLWNGMGVIEYLRIALMTPEALAALPEIERTFYENVPAWATSAFALAVWGGLLGSIFLLVKRKWAKAAFLISFAGIVVQLSHNYLVGNALDVYGPGGLVMPVMIVVIGVFLIWHTNKATDKGWLK